MNTPRFTPKADPAIAQLHAAFVKISQRDEPVRLVAHLWQKLLSSEEYQGNAEALQRDATFVARYLVIQIQRDRRMPGSLRLKNLLQEEQFFADLAEARQQNPKAYAALIRSASGSGRVGCQPAAGGSLPPANSPKANPSEALTSDHLRTETAASLRALREQLTGLTAAEVENLKSANAQKQLEAGK